MKVAAFVLLAVMLGLSQTQKDHNDGLLARLSYRSSFVHDSNGPSRICFAVYEDGFYRLSKDGGDPATSPDSELGIRAAVQGKLSRGQLASLRAMLKEISPTEAGGGFVLDGAESLTAEFKRHGRTTNFTWIDADHRKLFPAAVAGLVKWLEDFKAENSSPVTLHELSDLPLCPPVNAKPLQPVMADLNGGCWGR